MLVTYINNARTKGPHTSGANLWNRRVLQHNGPTDPVGPVHTSVHWANSSVDLDTWKVNCPKIWSRCEPVLDLSIEFQLRPLTSECDCKAGGLGKHTWPPCCCDQIRKTEIDQLPLAKFSKLNARFLSSPLFCSSDSDFIVMIAIWRSNQHRTDVSSLIRLHYEREMRDQPW